MRLTRQRRFILEHLRSLKTHPTADDIYPPLKKVVPSMSLGSLYRNLDVLAREGMIVRLDFFGSSKRYDGNTNEHLHFRCADCGSVSDYENKKTCEIRKSILSLLRSDSNIHSVSIQLKGLCGNCSKKNE